MILFYIYIHIYSISNLYRRVFIFFTEKLFLYLATFILFSYSMILKKKKKKKPTIPNMVEPFFDRSKAIYREGLYRSLEIFSNHVNNSGGCTHNPAEHSPTTTSLPPPPAMRRYLPLPLSFPRMTEEFGSGDRRWQPAAANSARCLRAFRRRTATNPRRPIDSTADKNIGAAFHAQSVPPLPPPPTPPPSTARWRKNDGPFCLASIFSLSLSSRSFVFPYFSLLLSFPLLLFLVRWQR